MMDAIAPVLVTGATGNVGREVVRCLQDLDVPFVAAGTNPARVTKILGSGTPAVALDFSIPSTYAPAVRGMRGLFLLRPPPVSNVRETLNVLVDRALERRPGGRAAVSGGPPGWSSSDNVDAGVEHIAFLSVEGADRQSWVPHHAVEEHLAKRGVSATLLRPGFFAQNLADAYLTDIRDDDRLYVPAGRGRVAFVDVRDVAELAARSFVDDGLRRQAFTLTGPEAVTFDEVAAMLSATLGRTVRYDAASIPAYALHLRRRRMPWMQIVVQTVLHVGLRFGNAKAVDPTLARLLRRPARSIGEYISDNQRLWSR
ncbi:MAG: NmrA family NAD(P)-binding protein [Polyangiaceae bacterium]